MDIKTALGKVINRLDLNTDEMTDVMRDIMGGQCTDAQIGAFLVALRMKSESLDEIEGAARVMRELATPVQLESLEHVVDIVGTGGDGANLFNVSSASTFVTAAAGAKVAKHGNRSVSSKSGSADLLESAGIRLDLSAEQVARCINEVGVGFMFAVNHHGAMKHAIGPRKEIGQRTIFNILGPLTNPAGVKRLVLGVFAGELCRPLAEVLKRLGAEHVMVVHATDGLDEISLAAPTLVAELKNGEITEYRLTPEDVGLKSQSLMGLDVADSAASLALIRDALGKRETEAAEKAADMIALNAGAALYVAGVVSNLKQGVALAEDAIHGGLALEKMEALAVFSQGLVG
ncbi:anthranilate phosphoribosyltransferase [Spongiibacter sp. KMU-158]|uniref:Anthranilate phosphoribosyltransferase n=1 Tax=Spongiibacter pelagi TaxID=2760804 RepID=A0A927BZT5_9GAMM|nr:anthranilate phosphoribosyltransferase [Spongiibacter pelagi]MBD2858629.1 anthranilate phosphoribosyltransferase [Spongiibacter pelagi]